jgi:hypothetical protein
MHFNPLSSGRSTGQSHVESSEQRFEQIAQAAGATLAFTPEAHRFRALLLAVLVQGKPA